MVSNITGHQSIIDDVKRLDDNDFDQNVLNELPMILPSLTDAAHRFIDSNSSGSISKEEIEDLILLAMNLLPVLNRLQEVKDENGQTAQNIIEFLDDLFRFLGGKSHGCIEEEEIVIFVVSLLDMICSAIQALSNKLIENHEKELRKHVIDQSFHTLHRYFGDDVMTNGELDIIKAVSFQLGRKLNASNWHRFFEDCRAYIPSDVLQVGEDFFSEFDRKAVDGSLPIDDVVQIAVAELERLILSYLSPDIVSFLFGVSPAGAQFTQGVMYLVASVTRKAINPRYVVDIIKLITQAVQKLLSDLGGMRIIIKAILEFVDMDDDGIITHEELFIIYDAMLKLSEEVKTTECPSSDDPRSLEQREQDYIKCEERFYVAVAAIFDSDKDMTIGTIDLEHIFDKLIQLYKSILQFILQTIHQVIVGSLPDLLHIILKVKCDMYGGSFTLSSYEVVKQLVRFNIEPALLKARKEAQSLKDAKAKEVKDRDPS